MKIVKLVPLALSAFLFVGCSSKFTNIDLVDFEPKVKSTKSNINERISIAVVKPQIHFEARLSDGLINLALKRIVRELEEERSAIGKEIKKAMISKGIGVATTYNDIEDMTYSQKKNTAGIFVPKITVSMIESGTSLKKLGEILSTKSSLTAEVKIKLMLIEPLSKEKVWVKNLPHIRKKNSHELRIISNGV